MARPSHNLNRNLLDRSRKLTPLSQGGREQDVDWNQISVGKNISQLFKSRGVQRGVLSYTVVQVLLEYNLKIYIKSGDRPINRFGRLIGR